MTEKEYRVEFPEVQDSLEQTEEWFWLNEGSGWRKVRFHDYAAIYSVPGLYEEVFYERLACRSPAVLTDMLREEVERAGAQVSDLRVLDLGAGNGIVAERLRELGCPFIVGVDNLPEAGRAAERDRPGVYDAYHVLDPGQEDADVLREYDFNCLITVAALGFDDIPTRGFLNALCLIGPSGWVAFNLRDLFLSEQDTTGYNDLIEQLVNSDELRIHSTRRFQHRLGLTGDPIHYVGVIGQRTALA